MILFEKPKKDTEVNYNVYYVVSDDKQFIGQIEPENLEEQIKYYKQFKNHIEIQ
jgi:hypothetical protein